ncbi:hypothetical protein [Streptomyces sp. NPDC013489]|uniref:hypothetical protein n=1 Tax=Streptomyces sp. NPDC013489 TaxID=3155606 RepID=UPI0033F61F37
MIRIIRTKTLKALQNDAAFASYADGLAADLELAQEAVEAYKEDQADDVEQLQKLSGEARDLRVELVAAESRNTDFARLAELLLAATEYVVKAAEAPLDVVLHDGRLHGVYRDRASAMAAAGYPDSRDWSPAPEPDTTVEGWKIRNTPVPQLAAPAGADEIEALLQRLERPALEQLAEADRLQAQNRELESIRSQRDTAIENTETAAAALTAESLAYALHRAEISEIATDIALSLSAGDPAASVREVARLLIKHADALGIDPHGPGPEAVRSQTKGAAA